MSKGAEVAAPPALEDLGEALADVVLAFRLAWPSPDEALPPLPWPDRAAGGATDEAVQRMASAATERLLYAKARDVALDRLLGFVASAPSRSYVGLQVEADEVMSELRRRSRGILERLLEIRPGGQDA